MEFVGGVLVQVYATRSGMLGIKQDFWDFMLGVEGMTGGWGLGIGWGGCTLGFSWEGG